MYGGFTDLQEYYRNLMATQTPGDIANQADAYRNEANANQYGDPSLGTDVVYPYGGGTDHFAQGETPYSFLSAGSNYAGGVKAAVPGSDLYNQLMADSQTRDQQGILKIGALVGGGAALANTAWGSAAGGTPGYGYGATSATDIAAGSAAPAGASGLTGVTLPPSVGYLSPIASGVGTAADAAALGVGTGAAGLGAGLGGGAMGGLGLGGWLTVGSTLAGALQGNKDQTSTTTNAPPAYIAPYLSDAAAAAHDQYGQGAYVSPLQQAASQYGTNVLNGSYLNSNPYLDATFNKAAGAVTNQVQSNFASAGRNPRGVDAAATAVMGPAGAGGGYDDLANLIYGGNYQAERNRQQQILPMTDSLGRIGNPQTALDDYIARLRNISGGYGSTTSSTPTQSNLYSGLAGLGLALIPGG